MPHARVFGRTRQQPVPGLESLVGPLIAPIDEQVMLYALPSSRHMLYDDF